MSTTEVSYVGAADVFYHMLQFVPSGTLCSMVEVTKNWKRAIEERIKPWHEDLGLRVQGGKYSLKSWIVLSATTDGRNPKENYRTYLGEPIGETPEASLQQIEDLTQKDPRNPGKRRYQTYQAIYLFNKILRPILKGEFVNLNEGRLISTPKAKEVDYQKLSIEDIRAQCQRPLRLVYDMGRIEVGMSIWNIMQLFNHPLLEGCQNGPAFYLCDYMKGVTFNQLFSCLKSSSIEFIRREARETVPFNYRLFPSAKDKRFRLFANADLILNTGLPKLPPLLIKCGFDRLKTKDFMYGADEEFCIITSNCYQDRPGGLSYTLLCIGKIPIYGQPDGFGIHPSGITLSDLDMDIPDSIIQIQRPLYPSKFEDPDSPSHSSDLESDPHSDADSDIENSDSDTNG